MKASTLLPALALTAMLGAGLPASLPASPSPGGDNRSSQPVTDTWITAKVKSELASTKGVSSTDISVTTVDGVVTLTGVLASDTEAKKAVAAARSVKGVRKVDDSGLKTRD
jgi:hyperosmotically inducible protein